MKKIFPLHSDTKHPDRVVEGIKHEIRKYLKRERTKKLPEGAPFWIFSHKIGEDTSRAKEVSLEELMASLDVAHTQNWEACYVEIMAKPAKNLKVKKVPACVVKK